MTLLSGSSSIEVDAPIERCWEVVAEIERAPEWQRGLESVEVVQRDDAGRALICDTVTDARVTKVRCRVRVVYEAPRRLEFVRVSSDDVDELRGSWELAEVPGGRTTLVTYSMAVDPGPVGLLARPLERALRPLVVGGRPAELAEAVRRRFPAAPHGPDG